MPKFSYLFDLLCIMVTQGTHGMIFCRYDWWVEVHISPWVSIICAQYTVHAVIFMCPWKKNTLLSTFLTFLLISQYYIQGINQRQYVAPETGWLKLLAFFPVAWLARMDVNLHPSDLKVERFLVIIHIQVYNKGKSNVLFHIVTLERNFMII